MNQTDDPRENISQLLNLFRPIVDDLSKLVWKSSDGFWALLCRCVLRRQFDALEAIVDLTHRREGHSSVPLLRPACEEFLWIKYLRTLDPAIREAIVLQNIRVLLFSFFSVRISPRACVNRGEPVVDPHSSCGSPKRRVSP